MKKLDEAGLAYRVLPGLSSIQLLAAKLGTPWQDWRLVSAHGLDVDPVWEVCRGKQVFFLTGGTWCPGDICAALTEAGLGDLPVVIAEKLSYPDEVIHRGCAADFSGAKFDSLSVLLADSAPRMTGRSAGWPDELFDREEKVPMTKQEVRANVLAKLGIRPDESVWDVGSGSGSVSIEMAFLAKSVWGCEIIEEALALSRRNREKFGAWNLHLVGGSAPEVLADFPAPDAVFIGGSRGNMSSIVDAVTAKNPNARILISAIALESLHEAMETLTNAGYQIEVTQVAVSRARAAGRLHLMMANNPIYLILGTKPEEA